MVIPEKKACFTDDFMLKVKPSLLTFTFEGVK
jgi:hypothetical protein